MNSGQLIRFSVDENPKLKNASIEDVSLIELSPFGLHWPKLDEDLSIRGILAGDFGGKHSV